jgi:hypothetical protein
MTQPDPGAQSGAEGAQGGTQDGGAGTGNDQGTGAQSGAGTQDGSQAQGQTQTGTVSQAEYDRIRAQLQAADQNKQKALDELKQIRDKDLPAIEKLTRDVTEATQRAEKAEADLKQARLENAFFTDNTYKWKNPKTALKLADLSKVEIDEDGTVHNLKGALEALAKAEPYLIDSGDGSGEDDKGKESKGSTGALGTGGAGNTKPDAKKALASRIPALRTRGIGG